MASEQFSEQDSALLKLGQYLQTIGYDFTTATPATHALVAVDHVNKSGGDVKVSLLHRYERAA